MAASERKAAKRFERANPGSKVNDKDERGSVRVSIQLYRGSKYVTGNISRVISVADARVSDVATAVEEALFGARVA